MIRLAFHLWEGHSARRLLATAAVAAFVFLLASTAPHSVHHTSEAAHHGLVVCKLYALAVGVQWLTMAAFPVLAVWLIHQLLALRHECLPTFWMRPLLRGRAPPLSLL